MRVLFTPTGREQFLAALAYIRRDNPGAARTSRLKAEKVLKRLATFPESGRPLPESPGLPYREVVAAPHRFFHLATEARVWVAAVRHSAQLPETP